MLVDLSERVAVSSVGWVDHGSLLVVDLERGTTRRCLVEEGARYLSLLPGDEDFFAVVHHTAASFWVSAHHLGAPEEVVSRVIVDGLSAEVDGDASVWRHLPEFFGGSQEQLALDGAAGASIVRIRPGTGVCEVQAMNWFSETAYDLMCQSMGSPVGLPGGDRVAVPVQRSSRVVIYDWESAAVVGHLALADRGGNPTLRFRTDQELWADDYDTLLVLDGDALTVRAVRQLEPDVRRHFIGDWAFDHARARCAVARPASGDVLVLDAATLEITHRAALGRQPLQVAVLAESRVVARDWKTGDLLFGTAAAV
jgi:hypothetical protein